jgi:hypothetical protein
MPVFVVEAMTGEQLVYKNFVHGTTAEKNIQQQLTKPISGPQRQKIDKIGEWGFFQILKLFRFNTSFHAL